MVFVPFARATEGVALESKHHHESGGRWSVRRRFLRDMGATMAGFALTKLPLAVAARPFEQGRPGPPGSDPTAVQMIKNLRRANAVAERAMEQGHHPFGAILVAADHETVLMEQGNIDSVNHAESTLARRASEQFSEEERWAMTLYSTAEPCAMCAGTQYWANIGRLVYGMSERQLLDLTGNSSENPTLDIPSRDVFSRGQKDIRIFGPVDEVVEEIVELHRGFWT